MWNVFSESLLSWRSCRMQYYLIKKQSCKIFKTRAVFKQQHFQGCALWTKKAKTRQEPRAGPWNVGTVRRKLIICGVWKISAGSHMRRLRGYFPHIAHCIWFLEGYDTKFGLTSVVRACLSPCMWKEFKCSLNTSVVSSGFFRFLPHSKDVL